MHTNVHDTGLTVLFQPPEPEDPVVDIIFVHGLQGHPRKTWTCKAPAGPPVKEGSPHRGLKRLFSRKRNIETQQNVKFQEIFWPQDLLPNDCPNARILTWGYDSHVSNFFASAANQNNILAHAKDLQYALGRDRSDHLQRRVIFVAHSLGGIIVKEVVRRASTEQDPALLHLYESTTAIFFLGTPHRGSQWVDLGETVRRIVAVVGFDTNDQNIRALQIDSVVLRNINENFVRLYRKHQFEVRTFQEAKGMARTRFFNFNDKVVDNVSSSLFDDGADRPQTINSSHSAMCRFSSRDDDGYRKVGGELKALVSTMKRVLKEEEKLGQERQPEEPKPPEPIESAISNPDSPAKLTTSSCTRSLNDIERTCLELFNSLDIADYKSFLPKRVEGTCQWLLRTPQYLRWLSEKESGLLWITGHPGCGKTTMSSYIVDYLSTKRASPGFHGIVCCFFCKEEVEKQRDAKAILQSVILQILQRRHNLIRYAKAVFDNQGSGLAQSFHALWNIFEAIATDTRSGPLSIIVDAIDECEEKSRNKFLEHVVEMTGKLKSKAYSTIHSIKFLITSRPYLATSGGFHHSSQSLLQLQERPAEIMHDVRLVIREKIDGIVQSTHCKPGTRTFLEESLDARADQTFLWVALVLEDLEKSILTSQNDFQQIVEEIPADLDSMYERFIRKIPAKHQDLAANILHVIVASMRPLTLDEINIIVTLQGHHRTLSEVAKDCHTNVRLLLERIFGPLIRISNSRVSFAHLSAKEYLLRLLTQTGNPLSTKYGVNPQNANLELASACVSYLLLDDFMTDKFTTDAFTAEEDVFDLSTPTSASEAAQDNDVPYSSFDLEQDFILKDQRVMDAEVRETMAERYKFFDYATSYWAGHFSGCAELSPQSLQNSVLKLSEGGSCQLFNWFRYFWTGSGIDMSFPLDFDPFIVACFFGHSTTVESLLHHEFPAPLESRAYGLYWASQMARRHIVDLLLRNNVGPDLSPVDQQTPLAVAARLGHADVVELLLANEAVNVNYRGKAGRTPLSLAAGNGHIDVLSMLLQHERIKVDEEDYNAWTPVFWAIGGNYVQALRFLAADVRANLNHADKSGRTSLSWAAGEGAVDSVKFLLSLRQLKADAQDNRGRTALSWAAGNGQLEITKLLARSRRINISDKDNDGRNAISWACAGGHDAVLKVLIKYDASGADEEDEDGWTPLSWALNKESPKCVEVLTQSGLVDVNRKDANGRSPLSWAASYGYLDIVRVLLAVEGIDVEARDNDSRTPLSWAASNGKVDMIRILVAYQGVEVEAQDNEGRTPLSYAQINDWQDAVTELKASRR